MKVNSNRDISFKGFYNNRTLKKGLEFAANNGTLFAASTTLALSLFARPASIWLAPQVDKENKKVACAKSISSSGIEFAISLLASIPIANAVNKIEKKPQKYLKPDTIKNLKAGSKQLAESKTFSFAAQMFKLGLKTLLAVPKAVLTCACLPVVMQKVFQAQKHEPDKKDRALVFRGRGNERILRNIGKVLDKPEVQKFSERFKDSNFPMHIIALTDTLTTATFIHQANRSKNIDEERKKALMLNAGISTGLSIACGYVVDKLFDKPTEKFIKKFREANKGMPNLEKQVEGIKIAKPILLVGGIYYIVIPFISTFLAEFADKNTKK